MATLLLELFSEEIPSRMQRGAAEQLQRLITGGFEKQGLKAEQVKTFVSPRHLAIQVFGLPKVQPDVKEERKGPKVGAPEQAMKGFLGATGLTVEQCEQRDGYYFATIERKGRPVADVAKQIIEESLAAFGWPKSMRWGARPLQWVRPLHRIVAMLDEAVVPAQFAHLTASNITEGHRFLAPQPITLKHAEEYEDALKAAKVVVDYAKRRAQIAEATNTLAESAKLSLVQDEALIDEVTGLVEWPVPLLGEFDAKFLELPPEVLISEMKVHQRYFALAKADGSLSNKFIAVANMVTADGGKRVIAGNARVLRARLSDGEFYWEQDRKTSLEQWGKKLSDVVFHAKVGMMDAKVKRIEALAEQIAKAVGYKDTKSVARAAVLAKADLTSGMVGEFPELQGIMGRYYAMAQKESAAVADAIRDHYKPLGTRLDELPQTELGAIISVADKYDSINSLFAVDEKPTGSKDPLALRRAALGITRIMRYFNWDFDIVEFTKGSDQLHSEIEFFLRERLKAILREENMPSDVIEAVFAKGRGYNPAVQTKQAEELLSFKLHKVEALAAIKRALNILAAEEKKAKTSYKFASAKAASFSKPAEQELHKALQQNVVSLEALSALTAPINKFFDDVLVTEEGFKDARLSLLAGVRETAASIADFSKIEG